MAIVGAVAFSEFFVLSLYLQNVLHYSPVQSGVAFVAFALSVVVSRISRRRSSAASGCARRSRSGCSRSAASVAWLTRLPIDGHYFWDLFPAFVLGGAGMGLSFVPITIGGLAGVERSDAGVASGLINTSRQIGGALGIAAVSAIAATATRNYADTHAAVTVSSAPALDHGFQTALYVLTGLLLAGAAIVLTLMRPAQQPDRGNSARGSRGRRVGRGGMIRCSPARSARHRLAGRPRRRAGSARPGAGP